ncbi:hypothetical protein Cgig2_034198 [Carnegiea gigantea]|uniref:Uncharacterized protein n=1 Tax=Carnegiea gigantea TaxID=171969 RepID=A0A9Q1K0K2_9CARY|nr:hypothetical protein Cgig2_034198 [Carnegiea gigantea]
MASAEVLSNSTVSSRKQALEAGKRRIIGIGSFGVGELEEFRKKKAAKAAANGQPRGADSAVHEKQASKNGQVQLSNSAGADAGTRIDPVAQASGGEESFSTKDNSSESLPSITSSRNGVATEVSSKEPATNLSHNESGQCAAENGGYTSLFFK